MKLWQGRLARVLVAALAMALVVTIGQDSLAVNGVVIYVDAEATGIDDGSTWVNAYSDLQDALAVDPTGKEIWVAEGVYTPTSGDDRSASFSLVNDVAIYGGFDPSVGDDTWAERDWVNNVTVLSGDIGTQGDDSDNSFHVFYHPAGKNLNSSAILDGFTITGGNADGTAPHYFGGGMYNSGSSPALANCTFAGNSAMIGGGIYNHDGSSPTLTNCTFAGNLAGQGGGIYNSSSAPDLVDCTFENNRAAVDYLSSGGGIYNYNSSPTLSNCTLIGNSAYGSGGGMRNSDSSPILTDVTLQDNSAGQFGGAMFNDGGSLPTLMNCIFTGNSVAGYGSGGGINNIASSPTLINCAFADNSAYRGGAIANSGSSPTVTNCTFAGNRAVDPSGDDGDGGAMVNDNSSAPELTNCILWDNSPDQFANDSSSEPIVSYSDVQGGYPGDGNVDSYPWLVDADNGDFHLGACSPCIDAGDNGAPELPPFDFEGDDRTLDGDDDGTAIVDMGVDEVTVAGTCSQIHLPLVLREY